ncbi:lactoylglutathione lyase [Halobacteriales archaeon QH_10_67_22]|nr:MAG: lactoylglutathione lyase [Halobacteriales archaeon QH_10_67_22]
MDLAHVALWVSDLEASLDFYLDGLGLERRWSWTGDGIENVYVGIDGGELQLRYDPDRTTPVAPSRADVDHVAFALDDRAAVDDAFERVVDRPDSAAVAEPHVVDPAGAYAAFVADPDDYTVELVTPIE